MGGSQQELAVGRLAGVSKDEEGGVLVPAECMLHDQECGRFGTLLYAPIW